MQVHFLFVALLNFFYQILANQWLWLAMLLVCSKQQNINVASLLIKVIPQGKNFKMCFDVVDHWVNLVKWAMKLLGSWKVRIRSDADTDSDTDTSHFKIHFCIYITVNIHTYFC